MFHRIANHAERETEEVHFVQVKDKKAEKFLSIWDDYSYEKMKIED
jgi:hypothetical protein